MNILWNYKYTQIKRKKWFDILAQFGQEKKQLTLIGKFESEMNRYLRHKYIYETDNSLVQCTCRSGIHLRYSF